MTTLAYTLSDSRVMLRRNLKHQLRYPSMTLMLVGMPIVLLLLFVYVFGGQLGAGLGAHQGRHAYLDYVVPGLLLITVASAVQGTSIMVAMDMTGGIIDRFRTMAIARASVLTGHVLGSLIQILAGIAILIGVAFGLGFHSSAGLLDWLAAIGILALFAFALIWLAVALGLAAKSVETASNTPMILLLLLFLSSGFVRHAKRCQRGYVSSPSTSPSRPSPTPCADCSPTLPLATTLSPPSRGASASPSWPTSGPSASTTGVEQPNQTERDSAGRWSIIPFQTDRAASYPGAHEPRRCAQQSASSRGSSAAVSGDSANCFASNKVA